MIRVKICGITNIGDAVTAVRLGADALGFVFADSPRRVTPAQAAEIIAQLPPFIGTVGVFVNAAKKDVLRAIRLCRLGAVQLQGEENDKYCASLRNYCTIIKAIRISGAASLKQVKNYTNIDAYLFDAFEANRHGGTGHCFNHTLLKKTPIGKPYIVAGGITPKNVRTIIRSSRPYGIDVSSGVEKAPGVKDAEKIRLLIRRAKHC